jgi:hypothetical protein
VHERLNDGEIEELVAAYRSGERVTTFAGRFNVSRGTVSARLLDAGVVMRTDIQDHERRSMLELFADGRSLNQIGRSTGRDPKTVRAVLVAAGLTPPTTRAGR